MAWRPHSKARVDRKNPSAWGTCDRCNDLRLLRDLTFQREWRGNQLLNIWLRVCKKCLDIPQQQLRPLILPPDPVPVYQPRPFNYAAADAGGTPSNTVASGAGDLQGDPTNPGPLIVEN